MSSNSNELRENEKTPREQIADILNIQNMADSREIKLLEKLLADRELASRIDELEKVRINILERNKGLMSMECGFTNRQLEVLFAMLNERSKALSPTKSDGGADDGND